MNNSTLRVLISSRMSRALSASPVMRSMAEADSQAGGALPLTSYTYLDANSDGDILQLLC